MPDWLRCQMTHTPPEAYPTPRGRSSGSRVAVGGIAAFGLLLIAAAAALAAVTIAGFEVEAGEEEIFAYWETASEIGNLGFYVWRSETHSDGYVRLPLDKPAEQFIPSEDFGIGAFYEYVDVEVTPGITYHYKVQDVPADGSPGELVGPLSAALDPPTTTPPPDTQTPEPTATHTPTPLPNPDVRFWAEPDHVDAGDCTTVQWQTENVQAVFFNDEAVTGDGGMAYCPCEDQTYVLSVTYLDGTVEDFSIGVSVTGWCEAPGPTRTLSPSLLATPTPPPQQTDEPTSAPTPEPVIATARPTVVAVRRTLRPTATDDGPPGVGPGKSSVDAPVSPAGLPATLTPTPLPVSGGGAASSDGALVEGVVVARRLPVWLFVLAGLGGVSLLGGGVWLWRRG